jgi:uncharacterized protein (DUF1800 family)
LPEPENIPGPRETAAAARHLLERSAFGPRPGDVNAVLEMGVGAWLEHQLRADELPDPRAERAVAPYRRALAPPESLPDLFARGGIPPELTPGGNRWEQGRELARMTPKKQLLAELQMAEIARHVASDFQLREVMVDFWTNHFNVDATKGEIYLLAGDYVERVIRVGALGRFEDLLVMTARHPAMLRYLDNASSRAKSKRGEGNFPGITENYARELLELHTLGVHGGYGQSDVIAAARILTGWGFRPGLGGRGYTFHYRDDNHDHGKKTVLGVDFPAGGGEEEGRRLLELLARNPATARHLAHKLCVRFVADEPPAQCIEVTSMAFLESDGSIKATLQALFDSPAFWAEETRRQKLKTPLEFLVSAVRGVDARLAGTTELARAATRLGEVPFVEASPAGRIEEGTHWLDSFTLARLGFARDMAFDRLPGLVLDRHSELATQHDPKALTTGLCETLLGGIASQRTRSVIEQALASTPDHEERFSSGVALTLSSPEFQWR